MYRAFLVASKATSGLLPTARAHAPLLPLRDQLTQRMPQVTLTQFEAVYDRPFWRDAGLTG